MMYKHQGSENQTEPAGSTGLTANRQCMQSAQSPPPSPGFAGRDRHHRRVVSSPVRPFIHLSLAPSEAFPGSQRPRGPQAAIAVACSSAPPLRLRWPLPSSWLVLASSAPR
ncbi:uncharacterized protein DS421_6g191990 [Arachis hypogaea]|nr:uncharacterized protein DS421_6g191990 [Arachis hypogaea]